MAGDKSQMLGVEEVCERLGVSRSYCYRVICVLSSLLLGNVQAFLSGVGMKLFQISSHQHSNTYLQ